MTILKAVTAACVLAIFAGAPVALAFQAGELWALDVETTMPGGAPQTATSYVCLTAKDWSQPAKALTGARCPNPKFVRQGDSLTFSATCAAGQDQGSWTFSNGGKSVTGETHTTTPQGDITTRLTGQVVDSCTT